VLVERDHEVAVLRTALERLTGRAGRVLTITGEAGAGKSSVVRRAVADCNVVRVFVGHCDPLATPRPLGPVRDVFAEVAPTADILGRAAPHPAEVGAELLREVSGKPTAIVVEDAQWIDEASVEVLRFLARRIEALPAVLLLTCRDGEVGSGHPLRPLLGDLARLEHASTMALSPLSIDGVSALLVDTDLDAGSVLRVTGGNPFFVSEIARHPGEVLPPTARDAVLASVNSLADDDISVIQLIACAPDGLDDRLLPELGVDIPTLRRLDATDLLVRGRRRLAFRHELARLAIESSVPVGALRAVHARLLDVMERAGVGEMAVLTHHAAAAGDRGRATSYAMSAAEQAARTGAHREAVAFLRLALDESDGRSSERAELLRRLSLEQYMMSDLTAAIQSIEEAIALLRDADEPLELSAAHDRRALIEYYAAHRRLAEHHAWRATELAVAGRPPDPGGGGAGGPAVVPSMLAYGASCATRAYLAYRRHDFRTAADLEADAVAVAGPVGDHMIRIQCGILAAAAEAVTGEPTARGRVLELVDEARSRALDELASAGYSNVAAIDIEHRRLRDAEEILDRSLPFTVEREIPICNDWQTAMRSRLRFTRGHWAASLEDARAVLDRDGAPLAQLWPNLVVGLLALRHGQPGPELETAWSLAGQLDEPLARLHVLAALAERAWLTGNIDERLATAGASHRELRDVPGLEWAMGDLTLWLQRLGLPVDPIIPVATPYRLVLDGRTEEAADWLLAASAPFDASMVRLAGADVAGQIAAIEVLDRLGATATADRARAELRRAGVSAVPARPRASTRMNPAGLTNRQLDVARLMAQGLTNAELATRLYISSKTADHHVSAVLMKLGIGSRRDVRRHAAELGLA
jgi:DNA-binding CsgD family transcriptional regulator